ncbi:MAG: phage virion morphogenesis protein [Sphingobium sp.]|uniref:phage virion morphogenesis protein n=1 Tax=Sphingobium sp. JAI105 TaxID=2787715 RepID=UPI001220A4E5|nr:phage virion morphogenesis protein [Sphingobium sp. JAI105]MBG6118756.1 phage virion morphogenesis protein [Sphingobium sp. JAI105]TAJ72975.1 MAG: phage virion morphogenesis protein [Sphingobium sp.]
MAEDLAELERWLGRIMAGLAPARRRSATLKLGQALRRANIQRIGANVEPEGGAMEKRKPGRVRQKAGGRMFRRLRLAKAWKIDASADGLEIMPSSSSIDRVAAVHHFGETDTVGRLRDGRVIRTKYPQRRLLGFADEDRALVAEIAASMLDPDAD